MRVLSMKILRNMKMEVNNKKIIFIMILMLDHLYSNILVINKGTNYEATLTQEDHNGYLEYKGIKKKLLVEEEEFSDYSNGEAFEVDDFNFDGIDDFVIKSGIGYGGVNFFYDLYIAQNNHYVKQNIAVSNYELYPQRKTLLIEYKSGSRHFTELYVSNNKADLKHYVTYENYEEEICYIEKINSKHANVNKILYCTPLLEKHKEEKVFAKVKSKKARLYDNDYVEKSIALYLIKGDRVELIDGEAGGNRFLIRFKGKQIVTKYINIDDIEVELKSDVEGFIKNKFPKYHILKIKKGVIGTDYIFVLESNKKGKPFSELDDAYGRKVVLVNKYRDGFKIIAQNNFMVGCSSCGGAIGDPFRGITVKGSYISFEELYGACIKEFQVITFKYDKKSEKWYLHKKGIEATYCNKKVNGEPKVETVVKSKKDFGLIEFSKYKDDM